MMVLQQQLVKEIVGVPFSFRFEIFLIIFRLLTLKPANFKNRAIQVRHEY